MSEEEEGKANEGAAGTSSRMSRRSRCEGSENGRGQTAGAPGDGDDRSHGGHGPVRGGGRYEIFLNLMVLFMYTYYINNEIDSSE
jgi:hypothetical protein